MQLLLLIVMNDEIIMLDIIEGIYNIYCFVRNESRFDLS